METLAENVLKTKLAGQVASKQSIKQREFEKVLSKMTKRSPVREVYELTEYSNLEKEKIKALSSRDTEKLEEVLVNIKMLETTEILLRTHLDSVVVMSEAGYQTVYNGASKHHKVQWSILRPRWFGWRQMINFEEEVNCDFVSEEGTKNSLEAISKILVADILKMVKKYKDNARVGDVYYNEKREKLEYLDSKPFRAWLHNQYNDYGTKYFPLKIQLIKGLADGNFEEAFEDIDFVSLTQSERDQLINELSPKTKKDTK